MPLLLGISFGVGLLIGTVGVGGILLVAALSISGLSIHTASATALFSFLFTGIAGSWMYQRRGSISWTITIPVCIGAFLFSFIGASVNTKIDANILTGIIAVIIMLAGIYILVPSRQIITGAPGERVSARLPLLLTVGAISGFGSGLSGAGGPLFLVPIMVALGFVPLTAIGAGQVLQIISAASGSMSYMGSGAIDFGIAPWIIILELMGILVGVKIAHAAKVGQLRNLVALLCMIASITMFSRAIG